MTVAASSALPDALRRNRIGFAVLLLLLGALYARIVSDMVLDWYRDDNYGHGFLVPFICAWFVWRRRRELAQAPVGESPWGLALVGAALVLLVLGQTAQEYFTMRVSLVVLLGGLVLFLLGPIALRLLALPIGYLLFMVPIPYILYDAVAFPMKLFVARYSVDILQLLGVIVYREGNIIHFPLTALEVADACSGLRSLMSLLALAVAYAFLSCRTAAGRLLILAAALPIALITNMARVVGTGVLAQYLGARAAEGFFHDFAGLSVFAMALVMLTLLGALVRRWER